MKKFYLLIITSLLYLVTVAQKNGTLKGIAFDTLSKQPIASATITVLQKKDSSLVTFTMTDNKGQFEVTGLANGEYRLLITHVNYHNSSRFFTIDDQHKQVSLGNVVMNDVTKVLDEVFVTAEAPPVTLIDDTVQYNAGSFKTPPNSNVEQLIKKMPGIKVDKDGKIQAQGQEVKKVLVDGKEFFGSDPKIATRNLPADAIDKVQVYDKASDQAQLTGFDDGNSEKTINLKLKKDKKKGLFGKISAGGGTNDRYEGKFNVNSFKGARQMSVIGMGNNTNSEGFSFMDMLNFSGELSRLKQAAGGGNISFNLSGNEGMMPMGGSNNSMRTIWGGGINYNNIIGSNTDFTSNYFYNRYNPNTESHTERQYFLPDSTYFYNQNSRSNNLNNSHRINLGADIHIDSFNSIKISPSFGYQQTNNATKSDYQNLSANKQQLGTEGYSNSIANSEGFNFRNDLLFRRKFRRKGRTFSIAIQTSLNETDGDGSLESVNSFYKNGSLLRTDSINQLNTTSASLRSYSIRGVYTEPIFKRSLLELSVARSNSHSVSDRITHDFNKLNGKFDRLNEQLTNNYENTYGYSTAGIKLRTQQKKFGLAVGINYQKAELEGKIISGNKDSIIGKSFNNMLPNARLQYSITRYRTLTLNYSGVTNQPTPSQLQPVPDNSNSLNIREGNPDLKQEYTNAVQLSYNSVNPFKNRNLFAFFNIRQTQNKIVNYDSIDAVGIKYTRPVNVNGVFSLNGDISLGLPVRPLKGSVNFGLGLGYNSGKQFINKATNNITSYNARPELRLDMSPTSKFDVSLISTFNFYKTKYSLPGNQNTNYFSQEYETNMNWQLPSNFYFNTEFTYTINNRRAEGFNSQVPLWNASVSKQFLKFNRGEIKFTAFDLLNRNTNISRSSNQNYIDDTRITTLRRFFLLTFTYSLTKNGLGSGGMRGGPMRILR